MFRDDGKFEFFSNFQNLFHMFLCEAWSTRVWWIVYQDGFSFWLDLGPKIVKVNFPAFIWVQRISVIFNSNVLTDRLTEWKAWFWNKNAITDLTKYWDGVVKSTRAAKAQEYVVWINWVFIIAKFLSNSFERGNKVIGIVLNYKGNIKSPFGYMKSVQTMNLSFDSKFGRCTVTSNELPVLHNREHSWLLRAVVLSLMLWRSWCTIKGWIAAAVLKVSLHKTKPDTLIAGQMQFSHHIRCLDQAMAWREPLFVAPTLSSVGMCHYITWHLNFTQSKNGLS